MPLRRIAVCLFSVLAVSAASCSGGSPAPALSRSPAPTGEVTSEAGPTTEITTGPTTPATSAPATPVSPTPAPTTRGGDGGESGYFFSLDGTYRVEADRMVLGADKFLVTAPKVWIGATDETKFPKGSFLATDTGAYLSSGGTWTNASSRDLKDDVRPVNGSEVLRALADLPVSTWHYRAEAAGVRHMGPMAEDFFRAFHLGEDGRHLATVDADGVSLAAVRALLERSHRQRRQIASLRGQVRLLLERVRHVERSLRTGR